MTIDVPPFRPQIELLLRDLGFAAVELLIEDSVVNWAAAHGLQKAMHARTALAATRSDGVPTIVIVRNITPDMQRGVISGMEFRGFGVDAERLEQPAAFLEHLVLHEAAHLLLSDPSEDECDQWAFDRLDTRIR